MFKWILIENRRNKKLKDRECPHCGKLFAKLGIGSHIWRVHTELGKNFNSRANYVKGKHIAWNKGLTKETDFRIEKISKSTKKYYESNSGTFSGKVHSDLTKQRISKSRLKFLEENPDKVPYLINHSSKKSYPETLFENALISSNIEGWKYNFQNGIYSYDFAFPQLKIDVEIDGGTHLTDKVQKIDTRRDKFSEETGWYVLRFTAIEVKKDVISCISKLKQIILIRINLDR